MAIRVAYNNGLAKAHRRHHPFPDYQPVSRSRVLIGNVMKQKRYADKQRNQARPVLPAGSHLLEARQEPSPRHAIAQRHTDGAVGKLDRPVTAVSAAAMARAVQTSPSYFSQALSRWSAMWGGNFYDLIAVVERFRSIPSLAVLDISISRQLNLETDGTRRGLEGR